jgi:hypothetical protein
MDGAQRSQLAVGSLRIANTLRGWTECNEVNWLIGYTALAHRTSINSGVIMTAQSMSATSEA